MAYFHATFRERLDSIQAHGLGARAGEHQNFPGSDTAGAYLAENPMLAVGILLEMALLGPVKDKSPREYIESIVVLVIDASRVDVARLEPDPAIEREGFWFYRGVIDVSAMPVIDSDHAAEYGRIAASSENFRII